MNSRFSFPFLSSQGWRGSILNVLRPVTESLKLSRVTDKKKSARSLLGGSHDSDKDVEQHQLIQYITDSTVIDISSSNQSDKTQLNPIENLDALGITFPRRQTKTDSIVFLTSSTSPPLEHEDGMGGFVPSSDSDSFDTPEGSLDHDGTPSAVAGTPINADLAPAESSATLFDPQSCSPSEKKHLKAGLENIGDAVILQCILQSMEDDCEGLSGPTELFHTAQDNGNVVSSDSGSAGFSTPLLDEALPELRLRKDPPYQLPPSIAIIEATPTEMDRMRVCHSRGHNPPPYQESTGTGSMIPYHCNRHVEPGGLCSSAPCRATGQLAHGEMIPKAFPAYQDSDIQQYSISEEHHSSHFVFISLIRATAGRLQAVFRRKRPNFTSPEVLTFGPATLPV